MAAPPTAAAFIEARRLLDDFLASSAAVETVERWAVLLKDRLAAGGKIMLCGNGGSACDAAHFAEELTGRFREDRRPLAAIACTDVGHVTCTANDYGFDQVFARWVAALGRPGDALILLSTSGNSRNLIEAARTAGQQGMTTLALLGRGGGPLRETVQHSIIVPGQTSDRIQELHMLILHVLVDRIERLLSLA